MASRLVSLISVFNNLQGDMSTISILFCILKDFCFQGGKLSMGSAFKQPQLSNQQLMELVMMCKY